MRWTVASLSLTTAALSVFTAWMIWVVSQGSNQEIEPGLPAFRYSLPLFCALVASVAAFVTVMVRRPPRGGALGAIGVVAALESALFAVLWFALVAVPFPA